MRTWQLLVLGALAVGCADDDAGEDTELAREDAGPRDLPTAPGGEAASEPAGGSENEPAAGGSRGSMPEPSNGGAPNGVPEPDVDPGGTLAERYPGDGDIQNADSVLFFDDFESGWGRWSGPEADTNTLTIQMDSAQAHAGSGYLRSTVTTGDLEADEYISSQSHFDFPRRVDTMYWRFYAWFAGIAPNPHHWVRVTAGTESFDGSGRANTVPPGDEGFWFDLDADNDDVFNFYVYWYGMRSGRCDDGTAVPGCAGDQGSTYYYGNVFRPDPQEPFARDTWTCIEMMAKANTVGSSDGELALWVDDTLVGAYRTGEPVGTWLRAQFHTGGCDFSACTDPVPFEGFDFRTSDDVLFKGVVLDAYYERGSSADKRAALEERGLSVSDEQTILYDDVVVATERIGCRVVQ